MRNIQNSTARLAALGVVALMVAAGQPANAGPFGVIAGAASTERPVTQASGNCSAWYRWCVEAQRVVIQRCRSTARTYRQLARCDQLKGNFSRCEAAYRACVRRAGQ